MWNKVASFILRFRLALLVFIGLITGLMGYLASKTEMAYELQKIIPDQDSASIIYEKYKQTFGEDGSVMVIGVATDKLFTQEFFSDWYRLTERIDSLKNIEKIISISRLYVLTKNTEQNKFEVSRLINSPPETKEQVLAIKEEIDNLPFYQSYIYNPETNATYIAITLDEVGVNTERRVEIVEAIIEMGEELSAKHNVSLKYSGVPYIRTVNTKKISGELLVFTGLSILITGIFLLIFFRSWQIVWSSLLVVGISLTCTIGSLELLGYKIGILTALIPPLIVVIAIQNCVYLLNVYHFEFRNHGNKVKALTRTISKIGLASFLTNTTTAVGFGVFSFTGNNLLDEFGKVAALNIMLVYVISIILIPIIFSFLPAPTEKGLKHLDRKMLSGLLSFVKRVVFEHRKWVYITTFSLLLISLIGVLQVKSFGYILDGISPKDKLYKDLKFFESNFKGAFPFVIFIDTKEPGGVKQLATLQKIEAVGKRTKQIEALSRPLSVSEILKYANQAYYDGNPKRYILPNPLDLGSILSLMPNNEKMDKQGVELMRSLVDSNFQTTRVSLQIADVGTYRHREIVNELENYIDTIFPPEDYNVHITGKSVIHVKGNAYLIKNLITGLMWALAIISVLMAFLFSSYKMVLVALIPNLIPLFITLGIMGYLGINLKESTILIFSVAYGIVVDLTIHYLAKYKYELKRFDWNITEAVKASIDQSGFSMFYSTVILFFGFIIFAFSFFEGTMYLGLLTSLALTLGLITNLFLLPSLLLWLEKRMNMKKELSESIIELEEEE